MNYKTILLCTFSVLILGGCYRQNTDRKSIERSFDDGYLRVKQDTLPARPVSVPSSSTRINLGFDDQPVYMWVNYSGEVSINRETYNHIYGFTFWDVSGALVDTFLYEFNGGRDSPPLSSINKYIISPYPGDATLLLSNGSDSIIFYRVNGLKKEYRNFKGNQYVQSKSVNVNQFSDLVSDFSVEIYIESTRIEGIYLVKIIGNSGIISWKAKLFGSCFPILSDLSFIDLSDGTIYFYKRDCILSKI